MSMYEDIILEHYRKPVNKGKIRNPNASFGDSNPLCGDKISIEVVVERGVIKDIKFQGTGCAISTSSTDILLDMVKGKRVDEAIKITKEQLLEAIGIEISPMRQKCALLPLKVLKMVLVELSKKSV